MTDCRCRQHHRTLQVPDLLPLNHHRQPVKNWLSAAQWGRKQYVRSPSSCTHNNFLVIREQVVGEANRQMLTARNVTFILERRYTGDRPERQSHTDWQGHRTLGYPLLLLLTNAPPHDHPSSDERHRDQRSRRALWTEYDPRALPSLPPQPEFHQRDQWVRSRHHDDRHVKDHLR